MQHESNKKIYSNLMSFFEKIDFSDCLLTNLQTAVVMTGVNQTDHEKMFHMLISMTIEDCASIKIVLTSQDCPNIKTAIEALVTSVLNRTEYNVDSLNLKKRQLTMSTLESWYADDPHVENITIMIPDFEQFNPTCIQELISILCAYSLRIPLILVVGVATAFKALHNVLPDHITSQLDISVFQSDSSTVMLNKILDEVILTHGSPFHLSGRSFKTLMDIFLFYDYSLHNFLSGYKMFMLEHFSSRPLSRKFRLRHDSKFKSLSAEDCDIIRRSCLSFRKLVESEEDAEKRVKWIEDDNFLREELLDRSQQVEKYIFEFHCCLRVLGILFEDLPRNDIGKLIRELYPICIASDVTKLEEYKECFKLLRFTSKDKFIDILNNIAETLMSYMYNEEKVPEFLKKTFNDVWHGIEDHRRKIVSAGMNPVTPKASKTASPASNKGAVSRQDMMAKLKENAQNNPQRVVLEYEMRLCECLEYLNSVMERYLRPIKEAPAFYEFFVFTDCQSVRRQILGAPRGALHNALFNPQHYLQCPCCVVTDSEQVLSTMPDCSIAYKLHLECNKSINLYDWLQAFSMVVDNNEDEEDISPEVQ
jgi:origin recognition complex subunit 3